MHALARLGAWKCCKFVPISGKTENLHLNVRCAFYSTYSMVTNCSHLKVHSRGRCSVKDMGMPWSGARKYCQFSGKADYALVSILRCSVKDTGMPWSGARKYCQFSGKTENWYAFTGAQSKTQVALVRCSISVKELSIMHLITDYLRTHSAPLNLRHSKNDINWIRM